MTDWTNSWLEVARRHTGRAKDLMDTYRTGASSSENCRFVDFGYRTQLARPAQVSGNPLSNGGSRFDYNTDMCLEAPTEIAWTPKEGK